MSSTREPRVAVVGATGAVGNQLIELIAARGFQLSELKLFTTEAGAMQTVDDGRRGASVDALESPPILSRLRYRFPRDSRRRARPKSSPRSPVRF